MDDRFRELEQQGMRVEWHPKGYIVRDYEDDWATGYWDHQFEGYGCGISDAEECPFPMPYRMEDDPLCVGWGEREPWWVRALNWIFNCEWKR